MRSPIVPPPSKTTWWPQYRQTENGGICWLARLPTGKLQNTTESAHLLLGLAEVRVHAIVEGAHPGNEARLGTHIRTELLQHPLEVQPTFEARIQLGEVVHEL